MKFKYRAFKNLANPKIEYGKMPLLRVILKNGLKTFPLECLVDSGASTSLISYDIAAILDIDVTALTVQEYEGIGNTTVTGYIGKLELKVEGFDEWITIETGFTPNDDFPVLGHSGFFDAYEITFRTYQQKFELKRKPDKKSRLKPKGLRN